MQVRFGGFAQPPFRNHVIIQDGKSYRKVNAGDVIEVDPSVGYLLMSKKDEKWEKVATPRAAKTETLAPAPNRAILDGKAE